MKSYYSGYVISRNQKNYELARLFATQLQKVDPLNKRILTIQSECVRFPKDPQNRFCGGAKEASAWKEILTEETFSEGDELLLQTFIRYYESEKDYPFAWRLANILWNVDSSRTYASENPNAMALRYSRGMASIGALTEAAQFAQIAVAAGLAEGESLHSQLMNVMQLRTLKKMFDVSIKGRKFEISALVAKCVRNYIESLIVNEDCLKLQVNVIKVNVESAKFDENLKNAPFFSQKELEYWKDSIKNKQLAFDGCNLKIVLAMGQILEDQGIYNHAIGVYGIAKSLGWTGASEKIEEMMPLLEQSNGFNSSAAAESSSVSGNFFTAAQIGFMKNKGISCADQTTLDMIDISEISRVISRIQQASGLNAAGNRSYEWNMSTSIMRTIEEYYSM